MAGPGNILIKVGAETASAVAELGKVTKELDKTATTGSKLKSGITEAAVPAAAALAALGAAGLEAAHAAAEHQAVVARLEKSIENTTGATDEQAASMSEYIEKLELATGVSEEQLAPAFAQLTRASGSTTEAQKELNVALDVAAATGRDVTQVSAALAKAHDGNFGALKRLIPGLDQAAISSKNFDAVLQNLADTTQGAMANSEKTAEGQTKIFDVAVKQLNESLGSILLPIMQAILPLLTRLAVFAADNAKAIQILAGVVAVLAAGIVVANVALKAYEAIQVAIKVATAAWTAAQWLLNAALDANPVGVVTLALAALVIGLVEAYKHSQTFRDIVQGALAAVAGDARALGAAFTALVGAAEAAWNWITNHWTVAAFAFGPIGAAIALIADNWDKVASSAKAAADVMIGAINSVIGVIHDAIGAVGSLIDAISRIHVPSIHLPSIPNPFGLPAPVLAPVGYGATSRASSSSSSGLTFNIYGAIDPEGTARAIRRILDGHDRRQGRIA